MTEVVWQSRDDEVTVKIRAHIRGELSYGDLCRWFTAHGWSTRYLYEAVRNEEAALGSP